MDAGIAAIISGLNAYGQMIDQFNGELRAAILEAAAEAGVEEILAIIVDLASDGVAALLTGPEGAAIAARAVSHLLPIIERMLSALQVAQAVQDVGIDGHTTLSTAIQAMPQPNLATQQAWQTGDDVQPANNPTPRGNFNPDETAIASYLQSSGHVVISVYEDHSKIKIRNVDSLVDGQPVEFKTLQPDTPLSGISNGLKGSQGRGGQSDEVLIDARNSPPTVMTKQAVEQQLWNFFAGPRRRTNGTIQRVTVLLPDGTIVTWPEGYGGL